MAVDNHCLCGPLDGRLVENGSSRNVVVCTVQDNGLLTALLMLQRLGKRWQNGSKILNKNVDDGNEALHQTITYDFCKDWGSDMSLFAWARTKNVWFY